MYEDTFEGAIEESDIVYTEIDLEESLLNNITNYYTNVYLKLSEKLAKTEKN